MSKQSALRERVLAILGNKHGVDEEFVAGQLAQVIRGETVKKQYDITEEGDLVETKRTVLVKPQDAAMGVRLYDSLTGGELGLATREMVPLQEQRKLYAQYLPAVDGKVVHFLEAKPALEETGETVEISDDGHDNG